MYNQKDLTNPSELFRARTRAIRDRIIGLQIDYQAAWDNEVKAFIRQRLDVLVDDYIERMMVIQRGDGDGGKVENN